MNKEVIVDGGIVFVRTYTDKSGQMGCNIAQGTGLSSTTSVDYSLNDLNTLIATLQEAKTKMVSNLDIMEQLRQVCIERDAVGQRYARILEQLGLLTPEEICNLKLEDFTTVYNVEHVEGFNHNYLLVTTDKNVFFVSSYFDPYSHNKPALYEPSMSAASRKIYLQYLVDNFHTDGCISDVYDDPEYDLQELIKNEQREGDIDFITTHYTRIREFIALNWTARDYTSIGAHDRQILAAIEKCDISEFKKHWTHIMPKLVQDVRLTEIVREFDDELNRIG
ncbi:hypothetical protein D3C78_20650 [compost metagenome]